MNDDDFVKIQALIYKMRDAAFEIDCTLGLIQREYHEFPIDIQLLGHSDKVSKGIKRLQDRLALQHKIFLSRSVSQKARQEEIHQKNSSQDDLFSDSPSE